MAETRPSIRMTRNPWIAWKTAAEIASTPRKPHSHGEPRLVGLGDDPVDDDARSDRDRQPEQGAEERHDRDGPQLARQPPEAAAEPEEVAEPERCVRERTIERPGRGRDPAGKSILDGMSAAFVIEQFISHTTRGCGPIRRQQGHGRPAVVVELAEQWLSCATPPVLRQA